VQKQRALGVLVGVILGLFGVEFSIVDGYVTSNRIAILLLGVVLGPTIENLRVRPESKPVYILLFIFVLSYTFSYLLNSGNGVKTVVSWVLITISCIMVVNVIDIYELDLKYIVTGLLVLNLIWLGYVIFYSLGNLSISQVGSQETRLNITRSRRLPTIYNGILNSSFINTIPSIFYALYYGEKNDKYIYTLIVANSLGILFLSLAGGSRQSLVTFLAMLAYTLYFLLRRNLKTFFVFSLFSMSTIGLTIYEYYDWIFQRFYFNTIKDVYGQVTSDRLEILILSVNKIVHNLLTGIGPEPETVLPLSTHNGFIRMYLSIGVVAGGLVTAYILILFLKYSSRESAYKYTWTFMPSAIVIMFIISMFNTFLAHYSVWVYLSISTLSIAKVGSNGVKSLM
jgi:hypothetical protein